jgi:hypothetical protein
MSNSAITAGENQVWAVRTDLVSPWSWSYSFNENNQTVFTQITVKHASLGIPQNLMFLLSDAGILVLPFWGLNPRETPDLNHTSWMIPISRLDSITCLSASGGVYSLKGNNILWIPVVKPYSLSLPDSAMVREISSAEHVARSSMSSISSVNDSVNSTMYGQVLRSNVSYPTEIFMTLNSIHRIWLGLDSTSLYIISSNNGTQVLYKVLVDGAEARSELAPIMAIDGSVAGFVVHPRTNDNYFAINGKVNIYTEFGSLKGVITPSFNTLTSLEMDNDGKLLFIGGRDETEKGRVDVFDLSRAQLCGSSRMHKPSIIYSYILFLFII